MEQTEFKKERIAVMQKMSDELLNDLKFKLGQEGGDIVCGQLTARLTGFIYSNMAEERDLVYYCVRPTFFDWLFRRAKKVVFNLKVKDLLLKAPKTNNTERIYEVKLKENGCEIDY